MYYLKYFFITSILGFFLEEIVCKNYESGILKGPWTPIYGVGTILIIIISKKILKKDIKPITKFIMIFAFCSTILSLAELIGGLAIEKIFSISFWDYSNHKYHIGKYICLEMTIIWGIISTIFICFLKPPLDKIVKKTPNFLIYIAILLFILDIITTIKQGV